MLLPSRGDRRFAQKAGCRSIDTQIVCPCLPPYQLSGRSGSISDDTRRSPAPRPSHSPPERHPSTRHTHVRPSAQALLHSVHPRHPGPLPGRPAHHPSPAATASTRPHPSRRRSALRSTPQIHHTKAALHAETAASLSAQAANRLVTSYPGLLPPETRPRRPGLFANSHGDRVFPSNNSSVFFVRAVDHSRRDAYARSTAADAMFCIPCPAHRHNFDTKVKAPRERGCKHWVLKWWAERDSNPRHPACKAGALTN